jgi:NADP-dependent 3-hydroxy acid dehydrogenase YdfG
MKTEKKVIVITGTSTGFGALMVKTFDKAGHTVVATMRNVKGKNAQFAEQLEALPNTSVVDLDVSDDASVKKAIREILAKHGKIDVLINNAGVYSGGVLESFSILQLQKLYDVNVWGPLRVNNEVLPGMRAAHDGLIITISSIVGLVSIQLQSGYNSSKFALEGLVEGSYLELLSQGVESVLIEPGGFPTEIISKPHINPDREGIVEAYGAAIPEMAQRLQAAFTKNFSEALPDSQLVADAALKLVNMEKGKRPLRTVVDPHAKGVDVEYVHVTKGIKERWLTAYGV